MRAVPGGRVEVSDLLLGEGVDREVDVEENGHRHDDDQVDVEDNLS